MEIYIPTRGRSHLQRSYDNLPPSLQAITKLVVDANEEKDYKERFDNVVALPKKVKGIASIRQHILENATDKHVIMLDDDLVFQIKRGDKILRSSNAEINRAFKLMEKWLNIGFAHTSMAIRSIAHTKDIQYMDNTRMMHVLCYDVEKVLGAGCSFTKGVTKDFSMDDFHMTLQLLRKGFPNRVSYNYATSPSVSNSKGGASLWRTLESHNKSAMQLKKSHGDFVAVKEKCNWQGMDGTRYDVIVQWKKAFNSSK